MSGEYPASLSWSDPVLRSQCDLVDLAVLSEVEDALALWTAARVVRCRHGAVPLPALLAVPEGKQL